MAQKTDECIACMKTEDGTVVSCNWGLVASLKAKVNHAEAGFLFTIVKKKAFTSKMNHCRLKKRKRSEST